MEARELNAGVAATFPAPLFRACTGAVFTKEWAKFGLCCYPPPLSPRYPLPNRLVASGGSISTRLGAPIERYVGPAKPADMRSRAAPSTENRQQAPVITGYKVGMFRH